MNGSFRPIEVTPDSLLTIRLFDNLPRADRARIVRYCEGRTYRKNAVIIEAGEHGRDVFFLLGGKVQASLYSKDGKLLNLQELRAGEMFGEVAAFDEGRRTTSIHSLVETTVIRMAGANFKDIIASDPSLAEQTILRLCELSRHLCKQAYSSKVLSVPKQILGEIYDEFDRRSFRNGKQVLEPAPTHLQVAERVGTTREQVTHYIGQLSKRHLLRQIRRTWVVDDMQRFREYVIQELGNQLD